MTKNKSLTTKIKEYAPPVLKAIGIGACAYVAADILDAGREFLLDGVNNQGIGTIINHPITQEITKTIPQLTGDAFLYFLPRRFMNSEKKSAKGPYYTEQILKYFMQLGAVLNGLDGMIKCIGTTIPYISQSLNAKYIKLANRVFPYVALGSLAVPFLDGKNKSGKKIKIK